jgi:hypothetical protein
MALESMPRAASALSPGTLSIRMNARDKAACSPKVKIGLADPKGHLDYIAVLGEGLDRRAEAHARSAIESPVQNRDQIAAWKIEVSAVERRAQVGICYSSLDLKGE